MSIYLYSEPKDRYVRTCAEDVHMHPAHAVPAQQIGRLKVHYKNGLDSFHNSHNASTVVWSVSGLKAQHTGYRRHLQQAHTHCCCHPYLESDSGNHLGILVDFVTFVDIFHEIDLKQKGFILCKLFHEVI